MPSRDFDGIEIINGGEKIYIPAEDLEKIKAGEMTMGEAIERQKPTSTSDVEVPLRHRSDTYEV